MKQMEMEHLLKLVQENPGIPVYFDCGEEAVSDEIVFNEISHCDVREYIEDYYLSGDDEGVFYERKGISFALYRANYPALSEDEAWERFNNLKWKKCIICWIEPAVYPFEEREME